MDVDLYHLAWLSGRLAGIAPGQAESLTQRLASWDAAALHCWLRHDKEEHSIYPVVNIKFLLSLIES